MKVKSVIIFDLSQFIKESNAEVIRFAVEYDIKSKTDLTNIFIAKVIYRIVSSYMEDRTHFTVFHLNQDTKTYFKEAKGTDIMYKRLFTLIEKTIKFPIVQTNIDFNSFVKMLRGDSPVYDELIMNHRSFAQVISKLYDVVKKYKFNKLDKHIISDHEKLLKLIESI